MLHAITRRVLPVPLASTVAIAFLLAAADAEAQVVVYPPLYPVTSYYAPVAAGYPGGYVANYSPAGNYAAVTAFSPPMATVANYVTEAVPAPVAVTSYYAPAPVIAAPMVAAPVTTYYAPAAVVPLYRRGPFGGLRPARTAMLIPY